MNNRTSLSSSNSSSLYLLFKNGFYLKTFLRLAGWGVLFIYAFLALTLCILRFWVVPNFERFYPKLESYLEERLNTEIQVDSFSADWQFFVPRLTVTNLKLSRPGQDASLTLPKVQVTFSLSSLIKLQPITKRIVIVDPELKIERLSKHLFNIGGFHIDTSVVKQDLQPASHFFDGNSYTPFIFALLLDQRHIEINNGHFSYIDYTEKNPAAVQLIHTNLLLHRYPFAWSAGLQSTLIGKEETQLDLRARFQERMFGEKNRLHNLYGTIYASIPEVDFGLIADRLNLEQFVHRGHGQATVWLTFDNLRPTSITSDISLQNVSIHWTPNGRDFEFDSFQGRIEQTLSDNNFLKIQSQDLIIKPKHRKPYYLGDALVQGFIKEDGTFHDGEMSLNFFDLQALSTIGLQLPIPQKSFEAIKRLNANGLIEDFRSQWRGSLSNPTEYALDLKFKGLSIAGLPFMPEPLSKAGFKNLFGWISLNQEGGIFTIDAPNSEVRFPDIFPEEKLSFDTLKLQGSWTTGPSAELKINELIASNSDAAIQVHGGWKDTQDWGTLEIRGDIHYLSASHAYRYIPLVAGGWGTNNWLRGALQKGIARNVKVDVYGPLKEFPYHKSTNPDYIFRIAGDIEGVKLDFLPSMKTDQDGQWLAGTWPWIDQIQGKVIFEGMGMQVFATSGRTQTGTVLQNVKAVIPSYSTPGVPLLISGQAKGTLPSMVAYVNQSPVSAILGQAFESSQTAGKAELDLQLDIPITAAHQTQVQGKVRLTDNFVHLNNVPPLEKTSGIVTFNEKGVWAPNLTALTYGKAISGSISTDEEGKISILASGVVDAKTVSKIIDSPASTSLLDFIQGETNANVRVDIHHGISIFVNSSLTGTYTNLPPPFKKSVESVWPLIFELQPCEKDQNCRARMKLSVADQLLKIGILYGNDQRGLKATRGFLSIDSKQATMPDNDGLSLYLNAKSLAWNDWEDVINHALKQTQTDPNGDLKKMNLNQIVANVTHFDYDGMLFENVRINAIANSQQAWSGSLSSDLFNGRFKWKPADVKEHSQLWADFDYLKIPKKKLSKKSLDLIPQTTETLPSMDIRVDQLTFDNYNLGEFSISTRNHGLGEEQYWTLEQLILKNDDAKLMVNGLWNSGKKSQSQTNLSATLDINDLGNVLERAHLQHVINDGHGQINLDLNWSGAPIDFNAQNLNGKVSTQLFSGQFLQVEPGAGRLLSLISLQQLFRRFALDFRDVVGQGFVFDSISGSIDIVKGLATTDSLRIVGPQATILSQGWLDLKTLTQKVKISVLPDINLSGASIALAVANPLLGVGSFLAQLALQAPLSQLFSIEYEISGSLDAPVIQKVKNDDRNIEEAQTP